MYEEAQLKKDLSTLFYYKAKSNFLPIGGFLVYRVAGHFYYAKGNDDLTRIRDLDMTCKLAVSILKLVDELECSW